MIKIIMYFDKLYVTNKCARVLEHFFFKIQIKMRYNKRHVLWYIHEWKTHYIFFTFILYLIFFMLFKKK